MNDEPKVLKYVELSADELALAIVAGLIDKPIPVRDPPISATQELAIVARQCPELAEEARRAAVMVGRLLMVKLPGSIEEKRRRTSH